MSQPNVRGHGTNAHIYYGLTARQKILIKSHLGSAGVLRARKAIRTRGDNPAEGWFIFRQPTTIHPPKHLALHYRDRSGKLLQVIWITRDGVTK